MTDLTWIWRSCRRQEVCRTGSCSASPDCVSSPPSWTSWAPAGRPVTSDWTPPLLSLTICCQQLWNETRQEMVNNNIGENGQRRMPGRGERRPKKPQTATPLSHLAAVSTSNLSLKSWKVTRTGRQPWTSGPAAALLTPRIVTCLWMFSSSDREND